MAKESKIPRRCQVDKMSVPELEIRNVILSVEELGADPLLTDAVILLGQAQNKVANYIDQE